jgi:hypothetical protein
VRAAASALLLLIAPASLGAQPLAVSPRPDAVSVTVYRSNSSEMDLEWLDGYALITETRTVDLPAGPSELRFEGVAGGIVPVSAIVSGLPGAVAEKNRDARLLSPGGLIDASLGKRVHIRRTSRATGAVTETEAVIRSGPDGVVLQTAEGVEALRCTGLPETLVYDSAPEGLTDKPTLAVRTASPAATRATLRLSYLAKGFDWRANYVVSVAPDAKTLDLFAWLTLANSNDESFVAAQTQAVAGEPNKEEDDALAGDGVPHEISLQCWAAGTTSDLPYIAPPVPGAPGEYPIEEAGDSIVVTGTRLRRMNLESSSPITVMSAEQEELGDLKLYRIPEPVTVAANAQKQVALLTRSRVPFERIYGASTNAAGETDAEDGPGAVSLLLRMKNVKARGLGLPLPAGSAAIFEEALGRPMLVRETRVDDTAIGQEVEFDVGESPEISFTQRRVKQLRKGKGGMRESAGPDDDDDGTRPRHFEVELSNALPRAQTVELVLWTYEGFRVVRPTARLGVKNGGHLWRAKVPANGRVRLAYTVERIPDPPSRSREVEDDEDAEDQDE